VAEERLGRRCSWGGRPGRRMPVGTAATGNKGFHANRRHRSYGKHRDQRRRGSGRGGDCRGHRRRGSSPAELEPAEDDVRRHRYPVPRPRHPPARRRCPGAAGLGLSAVPSAAGNVGRQRAGQHCRLRGRGRGGSAHDCVRIVRRRLLTRPGTPGQGELADPQHAHRCVRLSVSGSRQYTATMWRRRCAWPCSTTSAEPSTSLPIR
jgi:hypothetical protein